MGLRIKKDNTVWWPVTVKVPRDEGTDPVKIKIKYKLITRSETKEFLGGVLPAADTIIGELPADKGMDLYRGHVLGWKGIEDEDGHELPFSAENLEAMLEHTFFEMALSRGLFQASSGAVPKNS